jgi:hypothetical protein
MKTRIPIIVFAVLCLALLLSIRASASLLDDLGAHLDTFIVNNFPGSMSYTAVEIETISPSSDLNSLGGLIVDNFYVIDPMGEQFIQLSGTGKQQYFDSVLLPKMIDDALVAGVDWTWNSQTVSTYALVNPNHTGTGDTENIINGVASHYRVQETSGMCPCAENPFHVEFENGFGTHIADYDASLTCFGGDTCSGDATAHDGSIFCDGSAEKLVKCLANGNCQMDVAFVGYCGFPSVTFNAEEFRFEVSGFGSKYYDAKITLNAECDCPEPATLVLLGLGSLALLQRRRKG